MYIPKRYGQSKSNRCPFCGTEAVFKNSQGIPVCRKHKESSLDDLKCLCGSTLELKDGKFGPYFSCMRCGNVNFRRAMEINQERIASKTKSMNAAVEKTKPKAFDAKNPPKEITVRSDELDFMYE
ncbi:hypothetical protein COV19_01620 [Candidatus Woesearchaeota archaeon CG10_big_fil_rev_8_21_14_0_10_44_13]|nr:MAG: hypothetical protein COV19_01620 [Candidatus Woesearchaeota archaeon CG10_big_fil_rev_8_21_14_0_10_44_13]